MEEDGIRCSIGVTAFQEFFLATEGSVLHQLLLAVLLILGSTGVRRAVGTRDDDDFLAPARWVCTMFLGHGVVLDEVEQRDVIELLVGGTGKVIVQGREGRGWLVFFQVVLHCARSIQAEDNEVPGGSEHGQLE